MREFCIDKDFIEIHSPKLIGSPSESGSEVFTVDYFDRKAYLAQSPQFYKQMALMANFGGVFETGPVFRAENSNTHKHATEFTGFDVEFAYVKNVEDVMKFEEEMIAYAFKKVSDKYGEQIKELFGIEFVVPTLPFPRMHLNDVLNELEKRYGYKIPEEDKGDLPTEGEKLCKQLAKDMFNHEFIFIQGYDTKKRAFYHLRKEGIAQGYDLV
jgi:aspartyl-tRNA synthetase